MNEQKHKAALDALSDLIRSQLDSEDRGRFASVKRLSVIGQKLMTEMTPRAEHAQQDRDMADYGDDDGNGFGMIRNPIAIRGNDQQQMVREVMALAGPIFGGMQNEQNAKKRESRARELNELISARATLGGETPILTNRINEILSEMGANEDGLSMVPAVDVRRHQAGPIGGVLDAIDAQRPLADGEGRGPGALQAGDEARNAANGVGLEG